MIFSGLLAYYFDRKAEEAVPVAFFSLMIATYVLGIAGRIRHVVPFLLCVLCSLDILLFFLLRYSGKRLSFQGFFKSFLTPGFFITSALVLIVSFLYRDAIVLNWDDLNYWALFPKNMYRIDGVPTGALSVSRFRDYYPVVQYLYYVIFKVIGKFSEPAMFSVNVSIMVLCLSPFFRKPDGDRAVRYLCRVAAGIVLPYLCMRQMLYCLGVDCILTCLFGFLILSIFEDKKDGFHYLRISVLLSMLVLTKSSGALPALVAGTLYLCSLMRELWSPEFAAVESHAIQIRSARLPNVLCRLIIVLIPPIVLGLSWNLFCRIKGNTSYLGDRLNQNISDGTKGFAFPDYALETFRRYVKAFFTFHLNGGPLGISPALILILFLAAVVLYRRLLKPVPETGASGHSAIEKEICAKSTVIILLTGFAGYFFMMLYVYLKIFDRWEALSLSSYDRYITVYAGALLYLALYLFSMLPDFGKKLRGYFTGNFLFPAVILILISTVNFDLIKRSLDSRLFREDNAHEIAVKEACEKEFAALITVNGSRIQFGEEELALGQKLLIVDDQTDNERIQFTRYAAVPIVTEYLSMDGVDPESEEGQERIRQKASEVRADSVYIRTN